MRHGSRHSRRHRHHHRNDRPNGYNPQFQGPKGPREPRQIQIPTSGPTTEVKGVAEISEGGGGYVRQADQNYLPYRDDVVIPTQVARDAAVEYTGDLGKPKLHLEPLEFEAVQLTQRSYK